MSKSILKIVIFVAWCAVLTSCGNVSEPQPSTNAAVADTAIKVRSSPVDIDVTFGKSNGTTPCDGKGVCKYAKHVSSVPAGFTPVHIEVDAQNPSILVLTFRSSLLVGAMQGDQDRYFRDPSHSYNFQKEFLLTDPIFDPLQLVKPNPRIALYSPTYAEVVGDNITLRVTYIHD